MAFQLVRAGDNEIVVWQTEYGHIYVFAIDQAGLAAVMMRDAPDATATAASLAGEAMPFATSEARTRRLLKAPRAVPTRI